MRVLVFGDSIAFGGYDSQGGWVDRIKHRYIQDYINGRKRHAIINLGIGGDVSTRLVDRIDSSIASATVSSKTIAAVVSIGVNDSRLVGEQGVPETTEEAYEAALQQIFTKLSAATDRILVVGLTRINAKRDLVIEEFVYNNEQIARYDDILKRVAADFHATYIDVSAGLEGNSELYFADNLHLNYAGHELLAKTISPELEKMLR